MRTRIGTILIAVVALAVGAAAGWFAGRASTPNVPDAKVSAHPSSDIASQCSRCSGDMRASEQSTRTSGVGAHRPAANVVDKPRHAAVKVNADERLEADTAKQEEKPAQVAQVEQQKDDNPFPRYLDMFKNNPEALTAEFQKEAEADRASLAELRKGIIDELKLNAEQVVVFEKALDDLRDEVTRINEEYVGLIESGQMNDEDDGSILTSNRILGERFVAARETAKREAAEKLYEQLELDGVSDAKKQALLFIAAQRTSFSYECHEPYLSVYDKIYKNFGFGDGIFSWCSRARRQGGK